jgi:hypothetical protein
LKELAEDKFFKPSLNDETESCQPNSDEMNFRPGCPDIPDLTRE